MNWYHRHLRNIARVQGPLNKLASPKVPWKWTEIHEEAYQEVKNLLKNALTLNAPRPNLPFFLYTDASDTGIGAILTQKDEDKEYLITCLSRPLRGAELNYTTTEKKCLAVIFAIKKLRCYLEATEFTVITDHSSLVWLQNLKDSRGRLARWALELSANNAKIEHRKGTTNEAADTLSRLYENVPEDTPTLQLSRTHSISWYDEMVERVRNTPTRYERYRLDSDSNLYYYKPNQLKESIGDNNAW